MVNGLCTTIGNCSVGTTLVNGLCMTVGGNVCPAGKKLVDGVCVNVISECPAGNSLVNGLCTIGTTACPAGTSMVNGLCTTIGNCPSGSTLVNGLCSTNISCPNGFVKVNGVCSVTNACPSGTTLINGSCVVNNICPVGLSLINGICSIDTTTCPANKTLINGVCTTITNICNNGATNPPICDNICPNGATNYPTCTTVCINNSTNYPTCDNNVSGPITNPSNENTNGNNSKKSEGNTTGDIAVGENGIIYSIGSSAVIVGKSIIGMIPNTFTKGFTNLIPDSVTKATEATFATTKQVVNTKVGSVVSKTLSTIGVAATGGIAVTSLVVNPASLYELFFLPLRLWSLLMSALGLRKRNRPWGTVYDSITKQPLDPAYVVLQDGTGKEISTSTTDLDGRYGFLIGPGLYKILATKTNYVFPSQRLQGKTSDELYGDLYFGEALSITDNGGVIAKNIPLDPISFDWNEVAKKNMGVMRFYSKWDLVIKKITNWLFGVGIIVAVIAFASAPVLYNEIILGFYGLIAILRIFGVKPKYFGWVIDQATGFPLAYALIHIYSLDLEREYIKKVCDSSGRYYALVPPGKYTVTVDRQNSDGTYTPAFTTEAMTVKKGIINGVWKV